MQKKRSKKSLILFVILGLTILILTTATSVLSATDKPINLVFSFFEPPMSTTWTQMYKPWFEKLEKVTNGRVKVEAHLGGELLSLPDSYDGVVKGTVDMAHYFTSMNPRKFVMDDIMTFWSSDKFCYRQGQVYWELFQKFPEMRAQYDKVKFLWAGTSYCVGIATTKKPIYKMEDAKGLKLAGPGVWASKRYETMGLIAVAIPPEDVVMSLQTGLLDGIVTPAWTIRDLGWGPTLSYLTLNGSNSPANVCIMNLKTWNSLPADIQKIMEDMIPENIEGYDEVNNRIITDRLSTVKEEFGIDIIRPSKEELARWVEACKPVREEYIKFLEDKGLPGKEFMAEFLRLEEKYSSEEYANK